MKQQIKMPANLAGSAIETDAHGVKCPHYNQVGVALDGVMGTHARQKHLPLDLFPYQGAQIKNEKCSLVFIHFLSEIVANLCHLKAQMKHFLPKLEPKIRLQPVLGIRLEPGAQKTISEKWVNFLLKLPRFLPQKGLWQRAPGRALQTRPLHERKSSGGAVSLGVFTLDSSIVPLPRKVVHSAVESTSSLLSVITETTVGRVELTCSNTNTGPKNMEGGWAN